MKAIYVATMAETGEEALYVDGFLVKEDAVIYAEDIAKYAEDNPILFTHLKVQDALDWPKSLSGLVIL